MSKFGFKQERNVNGGKYYWELQDWVNKLFIKYDRCIICGNRKDLEPHHVIQVKPYDKFYSDVKNGVILCKSCHRKYHEEYGSNINPSTLLNFGFKRFKGEGRKNVSQLNRKLKQSEKALIYYQNEVIRLREELNKLNNNGDENLSEK